MFRSHLLGFGFFCSKELREVFIVMSEDKPPKIEDRYPNWILNNRPWVILFSLLIVLIGGWGVQYLQASTDSRIFFGPDNPQLKDFQKLEDTFSEARNILILVHSKDESIFSKNKLQLMDELTEEAWTIPHSYRVDSIANYQHSVAADDELRTGDLIDFLEEDTEAGYKALEQIALNEEFIAGRLISEDAHVAGVNVLVRYPDDNPNAALEATNYSRELRDKYKEKFPGVEIYLTGVTLIDATFAESVVEDSIILVPIMYLIIISLLLYLLKSLISVIIIVVLIALSGIGAFGVAGHLGILLAPNSTSAITVIMTVTVAHCVHYYVTFFNTYVEGSDKVNAIREALRINLQPIFLTSVTTIIGFLSLNLSDVPPMQDLGNIVAFGVVYASLFVLVLLPAILYYMPIKPRKVKQVGTASMDKLADWVIRHRNSLLPGMLLLCFGLAALGSLNQINDQFTKYFDEDMEFSIAADFADETLGGAYTIEYVLESGEEYGVTDPEYLQRVEDFSNWLKQQPEIMHVMSISDILKKLNKNMHDDNDDWYVIPDSKELAAQYLLLYEMSLPQGLDLQTYLSYDKSASKLSVSMSSLPSNEFIALQKRAYEWLQNNTPEVMHYEGAGVSLMFSHIGKRSMISSIHGAVVALVLISFVLLFALRSFRLGIISLLPNLLPAGVGFGLWALYSGDIGMTLAGVLAVTMGIVVDDTVHYLSKYRRAIKELKMNAEEATRFAFHNVGVALWVTTFVLASGFLVMVFATFKPNVDTGLLSATIIVVALVLDFLLLPPLLMRFAKKS